MRFAPSTLLLALFSATPALAATGEEVVEALRSAPAGVLEGVNLSGSLLLTGQYAARGTTDGKTEQPARFGPISNWNCRPAASAMPKASCSRMPVPVRKTAWRISIRR